MTRNVLLASLTGAAALAVSALSVQAAPALQPLAGISTDQAKLAETVHWRRHHHHHHWRWHRHHRHHHWYWRRWY
jgi:hypothetical protein